MKLSGMFFVSIVALTILLAGCSKPVQTKNYDLLASCMNASAIMYGTEWCPHCKAQKELFGNSFKLINYIDCDKYPDKCTAAGIQGYPTWIINGSSYPGTQDLYTLASKTGCVAALENAT